MSVFLSRNKKEVQHAVQLIFFFSCKSFVLTHEQSDQIWRIFCLFGKYLTRLAISWWFISWVAKLWTYFGTFLMPLGKFSLMYMGNYEKKLAVWSHCESLARLLCLITTLPTLNNRAQTLTCEKVSSLNMFVWPINAWLAFHQGTHFCYSIYAMAF